MRGWRPQPKPPQFLVVAFFNIFYAFCIPVDKCLVHFACAKTTDMATGTYRYLVPGRRFPSPVGGEFDDVLKGV